jgi:23S rRNA (guanosine2251-2'-O)-methyltransferase
MEQNNRQLKFRDIHKDSKAHKEYIDANRFPVALLCDSFSKAANIGMILRLAEAARLKEVILWNNTLDLNSKKIQRISRNEANAVPIRVLSGEDSAKQLKSDYRLIAGEWTNQSTTFRDFEWDERPVCLIMGSEITGLSDFWLDRVDQSIHIPMFGLKTSMNVACAASILTYQLLEKRGLF